MSEKKDLGQFLTNPIIAEFMINIGTSQNKNIEKILDPSTGPGTFLKFVDNKQYDITAFEIDKKMIEQLLAMVDKQKPLNVIIDKIATMLNYSSWAEGKAKTDEEYEVFIETLSTLKKISEGHSIQSFLEFAYKPTTPKKKEGKGVRLMTVHGAKGLEARSVYFIGLQNEKFPSIRASIEEEQRILFVGVSRPKEKLTVTGIGNSELLDLVGQGIKEIYK